MRARKPRFRMMLAAALALLALYAAASTYLWAHQGAFIFRPDRTIEKTPAEYRLPFEDVFITVDGGDGANQRIHAWWIPADPPGERCLAYFHGSALNIEANITHARRFRNLGFSVLLVSYRGYGKSDGTFPSEAQVYADARVAWHHLVAQKGIEPRNVFIYGHSLGGAVAIHLAVEHPGAGGLIVEAAFTSIAALAWQIPRYRLFPIDLIVRQRFDSISKVGRLQVPVLYLHGTEDELVPPKMSRELFERTASAKQLKFIPGGGHNNSAAVGEEQYLETVRGFVAFARDPAR